MHIRITFSLNYYNYIYSSDITKYVVTSFKEEQRRASTFDNSIFKLKNFFKFQNTILLQNVY